MEKAQKYLKKLRQTNPQFPNFAPAIHHPSLLLPENKIEWNGT